MPDSQFAGFPRNNARSDLVGACRSTGQSPSKRRSIRTSKPSPSRQNRRLASTSLTQIAEWWMALMPRLPGRASTAGGPRQLGL